MSHELVPRSDDQGRERTDEERRSIARDTTLAVTLIKGADPTRYGTLVLTGFANSFVMSKDENPTGLSAAYSVLVTSTSPESSALTFAQRRVTSPTPGSSGAVNPGITCNLMGHYSTDCPSDAGTSVAPTGDVTLLQHGLMMAQSSQSHHDIDPSWILLDLQSTISVIKNLSMHVEEHPTKQEHSSRHHQRRFPGFDDGRQFPKAGRGLVQPQFYRKHLIACGHSQSVQSYDEGHSRVSSMFVHRLEGSIMEFVEQPSGLYVFKPSNNSNVNVTACTMFTNRQVAAADAARKCSIAN